MSAIAEDISLVPGASHERRETTGDGGKSTVYPVLSGDVEIARVVRYSNNLCYARISAGQEVIDAFGLGNTPESAMHAALSSGISRMSEAVEKIRALSVERGDELLALAEGLA